MYGYSSSSSSSYNSSNSDSGNNPSNSDSRNNPSNSDSENNPYNEFCPAIGFNTDIIVFLLYV